MKHTNHTYFYTCLHPENNLFSPSLLKVHYSAFSLGFTVHPSPPQRFFVFHLAMKQLTKILIP